MYIAQLLSSRSLKKYVSKSRLPFPQLDPLYLEKSIWSTASLNKSEIRDSVLSSTVYRINEIYKIIRLLIRFFNKDIINLSFVYQCNEDDFLLINIWSLTSIFSTYKLTSKRREAANRQFLCLLVCLCLCPCCLKLNSRNQN